jgi:hypothetical protein
VRYEFLVGVFVLRTVDSVATLTIAPSSLIALSLYLAFGVVSPRLAAPSGRAACPVDICSVVWQLTLGGASTVGSVYV